MATLTLVDLTKRFGRSVVAVNNFNLEVEDGEFLVLLGPSGCGKTTTMRMVAGLVEVTEGSIYIGDRDVTDLAPRDRNVSMVFQNYAVWPHMSVFDNIAYGLKVRKVPKEEIKRRVDEALELVKLGGLGGRFPSQLSGGQQQSVAIARALGNDPLIILADEPTGNLDSESGAEILKILDRLHAEGKTLIVVTHDPGIANSAGRLVELFDGRVKGQ